MTAGEACVRIVVTARPTETIRVAARRMAEHDVGTIVVVEADDPDRPLGIVTDRDIAIRCVAADADPDTTPVGKVMSAPVQNVGEGASIEDAVSRMAAAGVRRLVVTGWDRTMLGILSLDDVLDLMTGDAKSVSRLLEKQNPHVPI